MYDFNRGAIACYQRAGFVIEGRVRDSTRGSDGYWTGYLMALLEDAYRHRDTGERGRVCVRAARLADAHAFYEALGFADQCEPSARYKRPLWTRSN